MKSLGATAITLVTALFLQLIVIEGAEAALTRYACTGGLCLNYASSGAGNIGGHDEINQINFSLLAEGSISPTVRMTVMGLDTSGNSFTASLDLGTVEELQSIEQISLSGFGTQQQLQMMIYTTSGGTSYTPYAPLWNRPAAPPNTFGELGYGDYSAFLVSAAPVPEPSTFLLLGVGAAGLATLQLRRRKKANEL